MVARQCQILSNNTGRCSEMENNIQQPSQENNETQNKSMTTCKSCGAQISKKAKVCPKCGAKNKSKKWLIIIIVAIVVIAIIGAVSGGGSGTGEVEKGSSKNDTSSSSENKATKYTINVGEKYTDPVYCDIEFVSVNEDFKDYDSYANVPAGYKVVQATFNYVNNSDSDFLATSYDFDCFADDESCEQFFWTEGAGFSDSLSAGKKATNKSVYFIVPENAGHIILECELNFITDNKIEFVIK